jgi:hypothetical protein
MTLIDRVMTTKLINKIRSEKILRVYVAGPLTSSGGENENVRNALHVADAIMRNGHAPFVPHLSWFWHFFNRAEHTYETWMLYDFVYLLACDLMVVLPGPSTGVEMEIQFANENNIPVLHTADNPMWLDTLLDLAEVW